jgi:hypothetical protein
MTKWMDQEIAMKLPRFWENTTAMYQSLISDGNDDGKEIEETLDCDCFDNMMDAKYEKVNPVLPTVITVPCHS